MRLLLPLLLALCNGCERSDYSTAPIAVKAEHGPAIAEKPVPSPREGYFGVYVCNEYFRPIEGCLVRIHKYQSGTKAERTTGNDGLVWFEMSSHIMGCDMVMVHPGDGYQSVYDFESAVDGGFKVMKLWRTIE